MKKKIGLIVISFFLTIGLTSCSLGKTKVVWTGGFSSDQIFKMEEESCMLDEANILMANYKSQYMNDYGTELWNRSKSTQDYSLEAYIKEVTLSQLAKMTCMNLLANQQKLTLNKEEKNKIELATKAYYQSLTKTEVNELNVSYDTVKKLYEKYALATKLYTELTVGVNEEVSDDDARVMQVMQIVVSTKEKADKVTQRLVDSKDFAATANLYNEEQVIEQFVSRQDVPEEVEKIIFNLDNEQISGSIPAQDKFYFYKIVNKLNKEKTDEHKLDIVEERAKDAFDNVYEKFSKKIKTEFNSSMWDNVRVDFTDNVKTDSFFSTFDQYLGELRKSR